MYVAVSYKLWHKCEGAHVSYDSTPFTDVLRNQMTRIRSQSYLVAEEFQCQPLAFSPMLLLQLHMERFSVHGSAWTFGLGVHKGMLLPVRVQMSNCLSEQGIHIEFC